MCNVESIEGLSIAEHASSKTRLFCLQAKSCWVSSFEAERSRRKPNRSGGAENGDEINEYWGADLETYLWLKWIGKS